MGIKSDNLELLWRNKFEDESTRSWGAVFMTKYDGEVVPQPEEVESVAMWTAEEIDMKIEKGEEKITPDSIVLWHQLKEKVEKGEIKIQ